VCRTVVTSGEIQCLASRRNQDSTALWSNEIVARIFKAAGGEIFRYTTTWISLSKTEKRSTSERCGSCARNNVNIFMKLLFSSDFFISLRKLK
jgi:hypothetical protein